MAMANTNEQNKTAAAIEVGKQITVEGATKEEVKAKVLSLTEQGTGQGLTWEGGFVWKKDGKYTAQITFQKLK